MRKIQIIADSCSDLTDELRAQYGIDYCRMNTVHQEQETPASLSWEYYTPHELYQMIRDGERVTTTQVPPDEFLRVFRKHLETGSDILYIACCSKQSGSYQTAVNLAPELEAEYPGSRIVCIDSLNSSIGQGFVCMKAAEYVSQGLGIDEVAQKICACRKNILQYVTVHSLEYLKRAGRVTASSAFFGNLLGVKPILISDADGVQTPIKKVRGRLNSFGQIVELLAQNIENPEDQYVYLAHSDVSDEELDALKKLITDKIPCKGVVTLPIGPIIGASIGPDAVGLWAWGKEVTYRVSDAN